MPLTKLPNATLVLAEQARRKLADGVKPTGDEGRALKEVEKMKADAVRWEHYHAIPRRDYATLAGRTVNMLTKTAKQYDLPLIGQTLDLAIVLRAFHDFLAKNSQVLSKSKAQNRATELTEEVRAERVALMRTKRLKEEGELVERRRVVESLEMFGGFMRDAAESLRKEFGEDARAILQEAIDDFEREAVERFGATDDSDDEPKTKKSRKPRKRSTAARRSKSGGKA